MLKNIGLFDFDRTLTVTDTFKLQVLLLLARRPYKVMAVLTEVRKFQKSAINLLEFKKSVLEILIKGRSVESIRFELVLFKLFFGFIKRDSIWQLFLKSLQDNNIVLIVTASPSIFIEPLFRDMKVSVIGLTLAAVDGRYTGDISESIPYKEKKVEKIEKALDQYQEYRITEAYTDDMSDVPMLMMANQKFMVSKDGEVREFDPDKI